jgi:hypothetical protein
MSRTEGPRTHSPARSKSNWPDLQHKYGKVGIAAVAAAVLPEDGASRRRVRPDDRNAATPADNRR